MRYELFDFQKDAVSALLKKMDSMQRSYEADGSLSAVSLTAPTGAGKTVISAAVAEGLFYGNDEYQGDDCAVILWLSDSPSLNDQTMKRFDAATDLLNGVTSMTAIGPDFAKSHRKLMPGNVYFLNRQLLGKGKKLSGEAEGGRSFYDVLNDTIEDPSIHLYLFIDEAHRGLGKGKEKGTSDKDNQTIYGVIIDGQEGINNPMPCVVGISATPERFNKAMKGRKDRDIKAGVTVPVSAVRESGLIKDTIELRTPKKAADTKHQDLSQACRKLAEASKGWKDYCVESGVTPTVIPLMVVQVEDNVSEDTLASLCTQIHKTLPWLDITDCFANVFGEHEDIATSVCKIPYIKPDEVSEKTEIRVLFAKDAVSTGWDCPRAEVIYSRRKRNDPTYVAQMIGRMIRTPLARRIEAIEKLNTVACYLPEYDAKTVDDVIEKLKGDNVAADPEKVIKNPADVTFFGQTKKTIEGKLAKKKALPAATGEAEKETPAVAPADNKKEAENAPTAEIEQSKAEPVASAKETAQKTPEQDGSDILPAAAAPGPEKSSGEEFEVVTEDDFSVVLDEDEDESEEELKEALDRIPKVDDEKVKECFESIISRWVRHDKPAHFLDLWTIADIISEDIDSEADIESMLRKDFYNNIEGEIAKHPAEFKRTMNDIGSTTIVVKRVDPLTGEEFSDQEELVENDAIRLTSYYRRAVTIFGGSSDMVKYYINRRMSEKDESETKAISRISAVAQCLEIVQGMEQWAENKTEYLLSIYGPQRYAVREENKPKWDKIEGNTKPYIERGLSVQAAVTKQNMDHNKYARHIISDENGWAYMNLNTLEHNVVTTELAKPLTVAFYRNQSKNLQASLSIAYKINGEWENLYPDFIFFVKKGDDIARVIVDPHGDWLGDSVAKLRGYVSYIKDHPDMFVQVLVVADESKDEYRYLDLTQKPVQEAIEQFTGSSAKVLFTGPLSKKYYVKEDY